MCNICNKGATCNICNKGATCNMQSEIRDMQYSVSNKGAYLISLFYEMSTSFTVVCGLCLCLLPGLIAHTIGINSTRYQPNCNFTNSTDVSNFSEVVIIGPSSEVTHTESSMPYLEGPYLCT